MAMPVPMVVTNEKRWEHCEHLAMMYYLCAKVVDRYRYMNYAGNEYDQRRDVSKASSVSRRD